MLVCWLRKYIGGDLRATTQHTNTDERQRVLTTTPHHYSPVGFMQNFTRFLLLLPLLLLLLLLLLILPTLLYDACAVCVCTQIV